MMFNFISLKRNLLKQSKKMELKSKILRLG